MNANRLGKGLVLIHLALSMLALSWSAAIFLQFTDWGWKEPRKELDYRVPSEYDKRAAALKEALGARDLVYYAVKPAQTVLREAEEYFPQNSLWYDKELSRLKTDDNPIEVKGLKYTDGVLDLETPGKLVGKPVLENPEPGIQKSIVAYEDDLKKILKESDGVTAETRKWIVKAKDITFQLNGLDDKGKRVKTGLYELLNVETKAQSQVKFEMEYLQPYWVDALKEAELYRVRRVRLEEALSRFKTR